MRVRGSGKRPAPGPCERHLEAGFAYGAPLLRAVVTGLCGTFGLVAQPGGAMGFVVPAVVAATGLPVLQAWFRLSAPYVFLAANAALALVIGLGPLVRPSELVGAGWLFAIVSIMSVACHFEWTDRRLAAIGLAGLTIGAYVVGLWLATGTVDLPNTGHLVAQTILSWLGLRMSRGAARMCDDLIDRVAERRVAAAAARARRAADRAHLAMLHDTANTTFLMVSTGTAGDFGWLRAQAASDLRLLTTKAAAPEHDVDLADLLGSLRDHHGLDVRIDVPARLVLPAKPAFAIYHGVREGLTNVRRHAGDPTPRLSADERDGQVRVRLRDQGRGFDPQAVPRHRRGLADSMYARTAEVGARVELRSAIGQGTTVEWTWSRA